MSLSSRETKSPLPIIESVLRESGFEHFGFAELKRPLSIGIYEEWLKSGLHGEMTYLERHLPEKTEPQRLMKSARSAIVVTKNYVPHPEPVDNWPLSDSVRVASYAKGRDYHHFLKAHLTKVIEELKSEFPEEEFLCFTDSSPVLERDLAERAGLGWVGKNTCLIDRKEGSLFLIAEIYTSLALPVAKIESHDHCGTCTRCLDACPTNALTKPRTLDARLCISYLTIESRKTPPIEIREKIGDWLFGCDICQTVCPWNIKVNGKEKIQALTPNKESKAYRENLIADIKYLLSTPNRALERDLKGTPLMRAGGVGLKRNALIVAANCKVSEVQNEIQALLNHEKLHELASWALQKLASDGPRTIP